MQLQNALELDDETFSEFWCELEYTGSEIAGEFPLLLYVEPTINDWSQETKREILMFTWASKNLGTTFPQLILERIGYWLQLLPIIQTLKNGNYSIDIITQPGQDFQYEIIRPIWEALPKSQGIHLSNNCLQTTIFTRGNKQLRFHTGCGKSFCVFCSRPQPIFDTIDQSDTSFLQLTYRNTEDASMVGEFNIDKYQRIYEKCEEDMSDLNEDGTGLLSDFNRREKWNNAIKLTARKYARRIRECLDKYTKLGFVFLNIKQVERLATQFETLGCSKD